MLANKSTESSAIRPSNFTITTPVEVRLIEILNISIRGYELSSQALLLSESYPLEAVTIRPSSKLLNSFGA